MYPDLLASIASAQEVDSTVLVQLGASRFDDSTSYPVGGSLEIGWRRRVQPTEDPRFRSFEIAIGPTYMGDGWFPVVPVGHLAFGWGTEVADVRPSVTVGAMLFFFVPMPEVGVRLDAVAARQATKSTEVGLYARLMALPVRDQGEWIAMTRWTAGLEVAFGRRTPTLGRDRPEA